MQAVARGDMQNGGAAAPSSPAAASCCFLLAQNIFLTKTSLVKLGDFGIARDLSNTKAMTQIGTVSLRLARLQRVHTTLHAYRARVRLL